MTLALGIDVAKTKLDVALRLPTGQVRSTIIANTDAGFVELQAWRAPHDRIALHVCLEATGVYWEAVAETLADAGFTVSVVNPARIKAYRAARQVRTKTDAVDARLIADFCASQHPPAWTPLPPAQRELRAWVARREALVIMRTQEQNRLPVAHPSVRPGIEALIAHLDRVIAEVEAAIRQRIDDDPDL
ncbi:MAG: transposase, partial [Candidatus Competibacter phosphatis]